ncbi:MAG: aconitate hydratase [Acidobacteriota bacterium]|nr:aconitate hydratase [Acidobacteriota bacterium]
MSHNLFNTLQTFKTGNGDEGKFYSLPQLEREGISNVSRLPISVRIVLESVLRNFDGKKIHEQDVRNIAAWQSNEERTKEVPFVVARVLLQDFTGVPLLVDLAAMRSAAARMGKEAGIIEPLVPVDLVIDHSVQVDYAETNDAFRQNAEKEFERNEQRYRFLKWGTQAFNGFTVVPPQIGICHQVNLEFLAKGVFERNGVYFPDTVVGTDSHTTMVNGLGVVGWGVGGIEAEAGMLGQPTYILTPDVIGVNLTGHLREGVTATDLVLRVTEMLRKHKVVGKFVEFHGEGASSLHVVDRATIGNMSPEYGATMGYFPVDERTLEYYLSTGRSEEHVETIRNYFIAQGMFGMPKAGEVDYTTVLDLDLSTVTPSVSGPRRPQDRIELTELKDRFQELFTKSVPDGGYGKNSEDLNKRYMASVGPVSTGNNGDDIHHTTSGGGSQQRVPEEVELMTSPRNTNPLTEIEMMTNRPTPDIVEGPIQRVEEPQNVTIGNGDVLIAAITSCTNTSNPGVMLGAGIVARKAVERGLEVPTAVKTSLSPGSRAVTDYLEKTGLQKYLDELGFNLTGYGCMTCIGNSGPLDLGLEEEINEHDIVAASVLSGNRNFEARVHQSIRANFLMSPPLVVAFALAGTVNIDMSKDPIGKDKDGKDVYLRDIWATTEEINEAMKYAFDPETYRRLYSDFDDKNPMWNAIPSSVGKVYEWDTDSTYIQEPPYFEKFSNEKRRFSNIVGARPLAIFGDSVTTDHISPAGAIRPTSPAGKYLQSKGVPPSDFNSYGSRRGNHEVMVRGTFANVRIKNLMVTPIEGGVTRHEPSGEQMSIYDAALRYQQENVPLIILAGHEYGTGSSRDWAAKGTRLLGVRAVVAESFERIHRSNLVGMGVLPLQFEEGTNAQSLQLVGDETFSIVGLDREIAPRQRVKMKITRADDSTEEVPLILRIDTPIEVEYYQHGGILPYVLRQLLNLSSDSQAAV